MGHQKYLFKKGQYFYFRRRIPGLSTATSPLFLSLGTKSEIFAHTWLLKLTMEFEDMLDAFLYVIDELPEELVARYMSVRLQYAISDIRRQHRMERMTGRVSGTKRSNIEAHKIALEILLRDGIQRVFPPHRVLPDWNPEKLEAVMLAHHMEAALALSPALKAQLSEEFTEATGVAPRSLEHHVQILEIYLHSKIACLNSLDGQHIQRTNAFHQMSEKLIENGQYIPAPLPAIDVQEYEFTQARSNEQINPRPNHERLVDNPKVPAVVLTPGVELIPGNLTMATLNKQFAAAAACDEALHRSHTDTPFGIDIAGACERSIKVAIAADKIDQRTADSRRSKVKLFCLLANVQTVTELEQYHLRLFNENIAKLPKNFNKSYKDTALTFREITARTGSMAKEELGRSPSTFNAHIDMIAAVLRHAKAYDNNNIDPAINTQLVKQNEKERGRKKRNSFKPAEIRKLFQHTVWTGSESSSRRHVKGKVIQKDGLYFVPLIVAYTGGRMEEIAGLTTDALVPKDGHYGVNICSHEERRVKNLQSERLVPLHEHLIALGLLEHREEMLKQGQRYLFPELIPTSAKKKFQSALRYNWLKIREIQLNGNPRDLCAHSLRHSFNQSLKLEQTVLRHTRLDILGHAGIDINDEVYGDAEGMPFDLKKEAIDLLPRVF